MLSTCEWSVPNNARKKNNKMKTELIKGILYGVTITIVGVLVANQIQKAIDKARVSTPNA